METGDRVIMLVERDEATRTLYTRALCREFQVLACADEREALALRKAHIIHAVVLEPGGDTERGWTLLTAFRDEFPGPAIPIILCSTLDERRRGMSLGASLYLRKPVLPDTLVAAVRQLIDQRK
jgi:DNA-binding response OmpR family regulator